MTSVFLSLINNVKVACGSTQQLCIVEPHTWTMEQTVLVVLHYASVVLFFITLSPLAVVKITSVSYFGNITSSLLTLSIVRERLLDRKSVYLFFCFAVIAGRWSASEYTSRTTTTLVEMASGRLKEFGLA